MNRRTFLALSLSPAALLAVHPAATSASEPERAAAAGVAENTYVEHDGWIVSREDRIALLRRELHLRELDNAALERELDAQAGDLEQLQGQFELLAEKHDLLLNSRSWRYTAPMRRILGGELAAD